MKKLKNIAPVRAVRVYNTLGNQRQLIALFTDEALAKIFVKQGAEKRMIRAYSHGVADAKIEDFINTFEIETRPMTVYGSRHHIREEAKCAHRGALQLAPRSFFKRVKYLAKKAIFSVAA